MVIDSIASIDFGWKGWKPEVDDARIYTPKYVVVVEATTKGESLKSKFADLPSAGMWADRKESDDELLEELGSGWRGFATEQ